MGRDDYTDMGGTEEAFLTTQWTIVEGVASADEGQSRALIESLLDHYWKPVYCYLRRKGHSNEEAKDFTQGFFHEVVLERHLVENADPEKGRFRSFLLMALNRYLTNVRKHDERQRRTPRGKLIPLDMIEPPELSWPLANPDDCFNYAWVSSLLERVLEELEANCHREGKTVHWHLFYDRILSPIMDRADVVSLMEICTKYGIEDEAKASNMIVTVKRRFQKLLREHLRKSVMSDDLLAQELEEIKRFFPKIAQDNG
jgi:DNA-directed RNA polymerase specialized sigma24 family protein